MYTNTLYSGPPNKWGVNKWGAVTFRISEFTLMPDMSFLIAKRCIHKLHIDKLPRPEIFTYLINGEVRNKEGVSFISPSKNNRPPIY